MDAVGSDQAVSPDFKSACKARRDSFGVLLELTQALADIQASRIDPSAQNPVQIRSVDTQRRRRETRHRNLRNQVTVRSAQVELRERLSALEDLFKDPERLKDARRIRPKAQSRSHLAELRGPIEERHIPSNALKRERRSHATDSAAHDDQFPRHETFFGWSVIAGG
jgi:hypothetical protein